MDLETEAKPRFLNHEGLKVWFLTDLENGMTFTLHYKYREPANPICRQLCVVTSALQTIVRGI